MLDFIAKPFGLVMEFIYQTLAFENYGFAIILFTIFFKILIFPLSVKQQKSSIKTQALQPELDALKERCGDDKQRLYEEQQQLYQKYGVSSMAGCLPTLISFPMILVLYQIIRMPLTYISNFSAEMVEKLAEISGIAKTSELGIVSFFEKSADKIAEAAETLGMTASEFSDKLIDMHFLGIFDLGETPSIAFWNWGDKWTVYLPLLIIPLLAVGTAYLQMWVTQPKNQKKDKSMNTLNTLTKILPLMTLVFCFILPAGLGLYFTVSNLVSMGQTVLINKLYKKKEG